MKNSKPLRLRADLRGYCTLFLTLFFVLRLSAQSVPFMNPNDVIPDPTRPQPVENRFPVSCGTSGIGCPYDNEPILYVKINIHYYLNADGTGNFNENNDGGSPARPYSGYQRADDLVKEANRQLEQNSPAWNAGMPTCKIPIRLVLGGVYFHRVPNKGITGYDFPWNTWNANATNSSSEINIHIHTYTQRPPLDYNNLADKGSGGVTQFGGDFAGVFNDWEMYRYWTVPSLNTTGANNYPLQISAKTLLHEIVHTTGVFHPFENEARDACKDAPALAPCWKFNSNEPPCNDWSKLSNNLMDYNEHIDWSLTPCQICTIYESFSGRGRMDQRKFVTQVGGCPPSSAFINLPSEICLPTRKSKFWLDGAACFNEKKYSIEINEVDLNAPNSNLTAFARWTFDGEAGKINLNGLGYTFDVGKTYNIRLKTFDACNQVSEVSKKVKIINCVEVEQPVNADYTTLSIFPNPTHSDISIRYEILNDNVVVNSEIISGFSGGTVKQLQKNELRSKGEYIDYFQLNDLQAGSYYLRFYTGKTENLLPLTITTY